MSRSRFPWAALFIPALLACALSLGLTPLASLAQAELTASPTFQVFLAMMYKSDPPPAAPPSPPGAPPGIPWDPRLALRGATWIPANVQPGQGYWKIVKGVWFAEGETKPMGVGDHDIAFDVRDEPGYRLVDKPLHMTWYPDQLAAAYTQAKTGEEYAGSFSMNHSGCTYRVRVGDGSPSEGVACLGMGSIAAPDMTIHTSYGFVWQWTIAPEGEPTGTPTPPVVPPTPSETPTPSTTPPPSGTPTPPPPGLLWDPRLDQIGTYLVTATVSPGQGYWRLTQGQWYDVGTGPCPACSLILVDARDQVGARQTGVPINVFTNDGSILIATLSTEAKPGEPYAANVGMTQLRPAYRVQPANGAPADLVYGMGKDSAGNTSYGFVWQWTVAP